MKLTVELKEKSYDIIIERGALNKIGELLPLQRRVLVVTDSGVPAEYAKTVADAAKDGHILTLPQGEENKNLGSFELILSALLEHSFTRTDCVVAVGGGVVGDMAGFASACYMRGIDFYNIPTTLLSEVDSSIGGKTAVDYKGVKNIVGAFYQPKRVVIDPDTLKTLSMRHISAGLAEAIKMAATSDATLFEFIENSGDLEADLAEIIYRSLLIKKNVVEIDPMEKGLRKVLNFGHTIGHAIESSKGLGEFYHGECVALGMLPLCSADVRERLVCVLEKYGLPTKVEYDKDEIMSYLIHDKKMSGDEITVVYVGEIGNFEFKKMKAWELKEIL